MTNHEQILAVLDASEKRREHRRRFLQFAGAAGVAATLAACGDDNDDGDVATPTPTPTTSPTPTPTSTSAQTDIDVLNFALNLEYLEAQFYSYAATDAGLPAELTGAAVAGSNVTGARRVPFQDQLVAAYAREIAADERAHVRFLRNALGTAAVAQPALDIGVGPNTAFSAAARAAGLIGTGETFDPYSSDERFLLGAFIFEDVGVTAYKGSARLISNTTYLEAAAGILAAEAYHAGLIRTVLSRKGMATPTARLVESATAISDARDSLDGASDLDQGIATTTNAAGQPVANLVPTDGNGIAFSRSAAQVLNIVYLNPMAVSQGGFFPAGLTGNIKTAAASS